MKFSLRSSTILTIAIFAFCMTSCLNDGDSNQVGDVDESLNTPSIVVSKAALIDALWGLTDDPDPNAVCVANSTFTFTTDNPLMVQKNLDPTVYNLSNVVIVSSIALDMPEGAEGRAAECEAGHLKYIVSSSAESPTDIEMSEDLVARQNLDTLAKTTPSAYPNGCNITAYFTGTGNQTVEPAEDDEDITEEETDTETIDEEDAQDEQTPDDDVEGFSDGDQATEVTQAYSVMLLVNSYDCNQNNTMPATVPATTGPTNNQQ